VVGLLDVICRECDTAELPHTILVSRRSEQNDARIRSGNSELDPSLRPHRLISRDDEAELLGVEREGAVLIRDRNIHKLHCLIIR
jgi:hypothetical protein